MFTSAAFFHLNNKDNCCVRIVHMYVLHYSLSARLLESHLWSLRRDIGVVFKCVRVCIDNGPHCAQSWLQLCCTWHCLDLHCRALELKVSICSGYMQLNSMHNYINGMHVYGCST